MDEPRRSREARARAETALVRVLSVTLAPSGALGVLNLRGTGFVARDHEGRLLSGRLADGTLFAGTDTIRVLR